MEDLPAIEHATWQSLGRDAEDLSKRVANKIKPSEITEQREEAKQLKNDSNK